MLVAEVPVYCTVEVLGVSVPLDVILNGVPDPERVRVLEEPSSASVFVEEAFPIVSTDRTVASPPKV